MKPPFRPPPYVSAAYMIAHRNFKKYGQFTPPGAAKESWDLFDILVVVPFVILPGIALGCWGGVALICWAVEVVERLPPTIKTLTSGASTGAVTLLCTYLLVKIVEVIAKRD